MKKCYNYSGYYKKVSDKNAIKKCNLDYFDIIYSFEKIDSVYLIGGAIRDIFLGNNFKDLDFVCICDERHIIDLLIIIT